MSSENSVEWETAGLGWAGHKEQCVWRKILFIRHATEFSLDIYDHDILEPCIGFS